MGKGHDDNLAMDEVVVYDVVLTPFEVAFRYNDGQAHRDFRR